MPGIRSRIQPRTGEYLRCKRCGKSYYATPSRAKRNNAAGGGYCTEFCAYTDRESQRGVCPGCGSRTVRHPNTYCTLECYHKIRKERRKEVYNIDESRID